MNDEAQDELDYQELIARVAEIDKDAAAYMIHEMRKLEGFGTSGDLWEVVVWQNTAQGTAYWFNIAEQLDKQ